MSSVKAVSSFLTFHRNLGEHTYSSFQNPKVQQHNLGVSSATSKGPLQRSPITLRHLECLSPRLHFFFFFPKFLHKASQCQGILPSFPRLAPARGMHKSALV